MGRADTTCRWISELDDLALAASAAPPETEEGYLRKMAVLLRECPQGFDSLELCNERLVSLGARLSVGASESAALALLPGDAGIMTSRGGTGTHFASVVLGGKSQETTSVGSSFALALVSALALSIVDLGSSLAPFAGGLLG